MKSKRVVILIHETEKIKQRLPRYKKAQKPLLIRLTEMIKHISTAEEIRELSRKLARSREEVENDIKTKMSSAEIFTKPKAFEKIEPNKLKKEKK